MTAYHGMSVQEVGRVPTGGTATFHPLTQRNDSSRPYQIILWKIIGRRKQSTEEKCRVTGGERRGKGQPGKRQGGIRGRVSGSFTGTKPEAELVRCKQLQNKHELHVNNDLPLQASFTHPHRPSGDLESLMWGCVCVCCMLYASLGRKSLVSLPFNAPLQPTYCTSTNPPC